ncbi:YybH family protein [Paenibacillus guangzhouensis]|uniref:YybH family protein n=1 Tax=Paenibacillus guangzhouensis TaxID=1473112 RepID=UPI001266C7FA|nr:DUF4440 domain-containing protein [Paenibacillus guangzhouensis]
MGYQAALQQYIAATNTHDFNQVAQVIDAEAVYWFSDRSCTTPVEIQAYFEQAWQIIEDEVYSASDISWIAEDANTAVCLYTYHWEGKYKGEFASGQGRAANVFRRHQDGTWRIVHEHLSSVRTLTSE